MATETFDCALYGARKTEHGVGWLTDSTWFRRNLKDPGALFRGGDAPESGMLVIKRLDSGCVIAWVCPETIAGRMNPHYYFARVPKGGLWRWAQPVSGFLLANHAQRNPAQVANWPGLGAFTRSESSQCAMEENGQSRLEWVDPMKDDGGHHLKQLLALANTEHAGGLGHRRTVVMAPPEANLRHLVQMGALAMTSLGYDRVTILAEPPQADDGCLANTFFDRERELHLSPVGEAAPSADVRIERMASAPQALRGIPLERLASLGEGEILGLFSKWGAKPEENLDERLVLPSSMLDPCLQTDTEWEASLEELFMDPRSGAGAALAIQEALAQDSQRRFLEREITLALFEERSRGTQSIADGLVKELRADMSRLR